MSCLVGRWLSAVAVVACPSVAWAQTESILQQPALPADYNQGRNLSVLEQPRDSFGALGIRLSSLLLFPAVDVGLGGSSNVYLTSDDRRSGLFTRVSPSLSIRSDWARHSFELSGTGTLQRYFSQAQLKRDTWDVHSVGRLDIGSSSSATLEGGAARLQEEPFTGQLDAPLAILSSYLRTYGALRGEHQAGRARFVTSITATHLSFNDINYINNPSVSQHERDRRLISAAAKGEIALTPGAVIYAEVTATDTDYDSAYLLSGGRNRDSMTWRAVGGLNVDLPRRFRGTAALGYVHRTFSDRALYRRIQGFSAEAELTYFYSSRTNFRLTGRRVLEEAAVSDNTPYFTNYVSLGVDQEIYNNVLGGVSVGYAKLVYIDLPANSTAYQATGYAQYFFSRRLRLRLDVGYNQRAGHGAAQRPNISEVNSAVSVKIQF